MRARRAAAGCRIGGRSIRGFSAAALLSAAGLFSSIQPGIVGAQDVGAGFNEAPLGTFTIKPHNGFSVVEPPAGVSEPQRGNSDDGSGRWFFQGWDRAPTADASEDLYKDAREALNSGRKDEAQRLFERLVAERPTSARAGEARQYLGNMYRGVETGATNPVAPAAVPLQTDAAAEGATPWVGEKDAAGVKESAQRPVAPSVDQPLAAGVLHSARVSAVLDGQFLSDAGDRVFFGAGSANLGSRARNVIQAQARFLLQHPGLSAAVEGHADDGALPDADSLQLSQERAAAVRNGLIAAGVEAERLTAYGRGRTDRVSDCAAAECSAQNRRVITILLEGRLKFTSQPMRRAQDESAAPVASQPTQ